jgi:hypothetical protein
MCGCISLSVSLICNGGEQVGVRSECLSTRFPVYPRSALMDLRPWKKRSHGAVYGDGASAASGLAHPVHTPPSTKLLAHLLGFNLLHGIVATCKARHARVSTHGKDSTSTSGCLHRIQRLQPPPTPTLATLTRQYVHRNKCHAATLESTTVRSPTRAVLQKQGGHEQTGGKRG